MNVYYPENLFLLLLLIPLAVLLLLWKKRREKRFTLFAAESFRDQYLKRQSPFYLGLKAILAILALVFLILALIRPQWDYDNQDFSSQGLDIMICLDISKSMDATDLSPSRLLRAKLHLNSFLDRLRQDRVGVIAFAGAPTIECPLTDDYAAVKMVLGSLNTDSAVRLGTDIGAALALAGQSFQASGGNNALILITDGEDHAGEAEQAAKNLASAGAAIYVLGVGTESGAQISNPGLRDQATTRMDPSRLKKLAQISGGQYFQVTPAQNELEEILKYILSAERERERTRNFNSLKEQFTVPALFALLLLFLEGLIQPVRRKVRPR